MITTTITCDHCPRQIVFRDYSAETWNVNLRVLAIGWTEDDGEHTCPECADVTADRRTGDGWTAVLPYLAKYDLIHDHVGGQDD
jgi:hypothetical protein